MNSTSFLYQTLAMRYNNKGMMMMMHFPIIKKGLVVVSGLRW